MHQNLRQYAQDRQQVNLLQSNAVQEQIHPQEIQNQEIYLQQMNQSNIENSHQGQFSYHQVEQQDQYMQSQNEYKPIPFPSLKKTEDEQQFQQYQDRSHDSNRHKIFQQQEHQQSHFQVNNQTQLLHSNVQNMQADPLKTNLLETNQLPRQTNQEQMQKSYQQHIQSQIIPQSQYHTIEQQDETQNQQQQKLLLLQSLQNNKYENSGLEQVLNNHKSFIEAISIRHHQFESLEAEAQNLDKLFQEIVSLNNNDSKKFFQDKTQIDVEKYKQILIIIEKKVRDYQQKPQLQTPYNQYDTFHKSQVIQQTGTFNQMSLHLNNEIDLMIEMINSNNIQPVIFFVEQQLSPKVNQLNLMMKNDPETIMNNVKVIIQDHKGKNELIRRSVELVELQIRLRQTYSDHYLEFEQLGEQTDVNFIINGLQQKSQEIRSLKDQIKENLLLNEIVYFKPLLNKLKAQNLKQFAHLNKQISYQYNLGLRIIGLNGGQLKLAIQYRIQEQNLLLNSRERNLNNSIQMGQSLAIQKQNYQDLLFSYDQINQIKLSIENLLKQTDYNPYVQYLKNLLKTLNFNEGLINETANKIYKDQQLSQYYNIEYGTTEYILQIIRIFKYQLCILLYPI
ncbi:hypothetical protein pb186bvf_014941 [Paramecium bursaria]